MQAQALTSVGIILWLAFAPATVGQNSNPTNRTDNSEIIRGSRGKAQIALTFDAGANPDCFEDLIVALAKADVHSTFFVTGTWAQQNRACAKSITRNGHEVGNHTMNHLDLTRRSNETIQKELLRAETILFQTSGQNPRPNWRAPFGARDERVLRVARSIGYRSIYWSLDSLDSVAPLKTPQFLVQRVTGRSNAELDGAIILMHVGEKSTVEALPLIIANLQGRGFQLVTISKLLSPGY